LRSLELPNTLMATVAFAGTWATLESRRLLSFFPSYSMPVQIRCESCSRKLRIPENLLGKTVRCPSCQATFTAKVEEEPAVAMIDDEPETPAPPRARPRPPDRAEYDAPRPSNRAQRARDALNLPSILIIVNGGIAVVLGLILGAIFVVHAQTIFVPVVVPSGMYHPRMTTYIAAAWDAVGGLIYGGISLATALYMRSLRRHSSAVVGSVVIMLPCSGCCFLGLPLGIWSLVVLTRPDVKDAFVN
jgi:hypothetical protein